MKMPACPICVFRRRLARGQCGLSEDVSALAIKECVTESLISERLQSPTAIPTTIMKCVSAADIGIVRRAHLENPK